MTKQILFITEHLNKFMNIEQLQSIKNACSSADYEFKVTNKPPNAFVEIKAPNVLLCSHFCLLSALQDNQYIPKSNVLIFGSNKDKVSYTGHEKQLNELRFILGEPSNILLEILVLHSLNYFKNKEIENVNEHFNLQNTSSFSCKLKNSKERDKTQLEITNFFKTHLEKNTANLNWVASTYAKNLVDILDELLMNAIWNANPKYMNEDRKKAIELLDNEVIDVLCMFDGNHLILSVTDLFGTFPASAIQKQIKYNFGIKEEIQLTEESKNTGLGLIITMKNIGVLIFEVEKGKVTRVTAIARADQSLKDMQKKSKTLLFYEKI